MPRHKIAQNCNIRPWASASPDCREKIFTMIGNSLLLSEAFQALTPGARQLYICMTVCSAGKRDFLFPAATAKRYGFAEKSFRRYLKELCGAGFIELVSSGRLTREPNQYSFCLDWKPQKPP